MYAATARLRSSRPVNGSQLFASSSPIAVRVASMASAGGGRSVSRFSKRRTSGSSPAAAATRSMLKPGICSRRWTLTALPGLDDAAGTHAGDLDRMTGDRKAVPAGQAGQPVVEVAIPELDDAVTFRADEMVVMAGPAQAVAQLAGVVTQLVDDAACAQRCERAVDGR